MASSISPVLAPSHSQESRVLSNLFIIWLDKHIGQVDECIMLKSSFFLAMDPTTGLYEQSLNIDDISRSIRLEAPLLVQLEEVEFMFQAFDDVEKCFKTIEENLNKRIFFITSGSKGRIIIPSLIANFPETFIPEYWMFVFCGNMKMIEDHGIKPTNIWALEFSNNILMYDHQDDLLARMVLDIADYFSTKADDLENNRAQDNNQQWDNNQRLDSACQQLYWCRQMYQRYGIMEKRNMDRKLTDINRRIGDIKQQQKQQQKQHQSTDDEDGHGEACDE